MWHYFGILLGFLWAFLAIYPKLRNHLALSGWKKQIKGHFEHYPKPSPSNGEDVLVIVNPKSGRGLANLIYHQIISPLLIHEGFKLEAFFPQSSGHTRTFLSEKPTLSYSIIIIVSGDGMIHEVLNGIYLQCNKQESTFFTGLKRIKLAMIPAGSMNGMATSLGFSDPVAAVQQILADSKTQVDLLKYTRGDQTLYDCSYLSWAIIGEMDQWQERRLRGFGILREVLPLLIVLVQAKMHPARLEFCPVKTDSVYYSDASKLPVSQTDPTTRVIEDEFLLCLVTNLPTGGPSQLLSPGLKVHDESFDILICRKKITRMEIISLFWSIDDTASHLKNPNIEIYKASKASLSPKNPTGFMGLSGEDVPYGEWNIEVCPTACLNFIG